MYTIIIIIITIISMIIIIIIIIMIGRSANNRNGRPPKPNKINIKCLNTETTHTEYEKLKQMAGDVFLIVVATSEIHPDERPWLQHYADDLCVISGSLVCRSGSLTLSLSLFAFSTVPQTSSDDHILALFADAFSAPVSCVYLA